ncbi:UDP-glycosyltransferase 79A6 [Cicer arietinum]|uniref:Glycosyltransferase n=1 Tax=Cicer arietinum TaxID=3827 RepID=A0A067XVE1_CICAR|nr:UDP-glycosyltransferase 79A6 [Cicer arietinum]AGU14091.1 UDP-glycosyltransferase [Cicer arietinum]
MSSEAMSNNDKLHVFMFPFLAFGHISPFVQLSNKLFSHGVQITFLSASSNIPRIKSTLNLNPSIKIIPLQFPNGISSTADLPPHLAGNLIHAIDSTQPQLKSLFLELKPNFVFFDFAQNWLPKLASEVGVKSIHFSVFSAISDAYIIVPSRLDDIEGRSITFEDLKKPPQGYPKNNIFLKTFEAMDFMFLFQKFTEDITGYERALQSLSECSYVVFKSCKEMEGPYIDYIEKQFGKQVLSVGPLVPEPPMDVLEEKWLKWLDNFPAKTVIFCSFGSETYLNDDQISELATGLELTGLPFILVLNFPSNLCAKTELERTLPKGFLERVKDRGVVHSGWLQQQHILKHTSVGCYVCHGGFSSVIEAMINDCQLVLLPFKGDQFFNSKLIAKDLEAGIEVNRNEEDGFFHKEDILKAVKIIMVEDEKEPGKSIRENHMKWRKFILNKEVQDKFIKDLVAQLKSLA